MTNKDDEIIDEGDTGEDLLDENDEIEIEIHPDGTMYLTQEIRDRLKIMGMVEVEVIDGVFIIRPITVH